MNDAIILYARGLYTAKETMELTDLSFEELEKAVLKRQILRLVNEVSWFDYYAFQPSPPEAVRVRFDSMMAQAKVLGISVDELQEALTNLPLDES